jgi:hypothetical protein
MVSNYPEQKKSNQHKSPGSTHFRQLFFRCPDGVAAFLKGKCEYTELVALDRAHQAPQWHDSRRTLASGRGAHRSCTAKKATAPLLAKCAGLDMTMLRSAAVPNPTDIPFGVVL